VGPADHRDQTEGESRDVNSMKGGQMKVEERVEREWKGKGG